MRTPSWFLVEPSRLSAAADKTLTLADQSGAGIFVSAVTVVEVVYLVEKGKLPPAALAALVNTLADSAEPFSVLPVDLAVAQAASHIPIAIVPDMPDRIIDATGLANGFAVVTSDAKIRAAPIPTIW